MNRKLIIVKLYLLMPEMRQLVNAWLWTRWAKYVLEPFWRGAIHLYCIVFRVDYDKLKEEEDL